MKTLRMTALLLVLSWGTSVQDALAQEAAQPAAPPMADLESRLQTIVERLETLQKEVEGLRVEYRSVTKQLEKINEDLGVGRSRRTAPEPPTIDQQLSDIRRTMETRSVPASGTLIVHNYTGRMQALDVNNSQYSIPPGRTELPVAGDRVIARLPNQAPLPLDWKEVDGRRERILNIQ